ncbi:MAG TPA: hypothetical protein VEJ86_04220 [Candidatus Binataceae bacterium]|nr:hypothetical protein [Candidatus Binataceae bacterium]
MMQCPSCGRRLEPQLICPDCGAPVAADLDCFAALGLPRKLTIDLPELERIYHERSRALHPDRFANQTPPVRRASLLATALLTRSYRTLRDPVTRGLYWLALSGEKLAENNKSVPPDLAEMVFDIQEQLAELRATKNGARRAAVLERRGEVQALWDSAHRELAQNFARQDAAGVGPETRALAVELKTVLSKIAYLRTLLRDIDRELENVKAA